MGDSLYWARVGHIGRDLLSESAERLFSPDSKMTLDAITEKAGKADTLELSFGGGEVPGLVIALRSCVVTAKQITLRLKNKN